MTILMASEMHGASLFVLRTPREPPYGGITSTYGPIRLSS